MAQPLARPNDDTPSGIGAAADSLEKAFHRLEAAVARISKEHPSLKADHEKLNLLLRQTEEKSVELKQVTGTVIKRLTHTIDKLEKMEE